ncbi:MAG: hypothetical protein AAF573_13170 [Bacteroidota bacterium]
MNLFKNIFCICLVTLTYQVAMAQPSGGGLETSEVEVIKEFDARLADTEKLKVLPGLPPLDTISRRLNYNVPTKTVPVDYPDPSLRPIALRKQRVDPGYKGFLKLGYGLPSSPYGEFGYNLGGGKEAYNLGLHLLHNSANFDNDFEFQRYALTDVGLKGTYYLEEGGMAVGGKLGYTVDEVHYYGYDNSDTTLTREQVRQRFNTLKGQFNLFNGERNDMDVSYDAGIGFYTLNDNFAANEFGFNIGLSGTKWFNERHPLTIAVTTDFTTYEDSVKQKLNNFYLQPSYTYHGDKVRVKVGINLVSFDDSFDLLPDLELSYALLGARLAVFGGWRGDYVKNSMQRLTDYNPFISTFGRLDLRNTVYNHFYGGVRGNLGIVEYNGQIGYKNAEDLALFLTDPTDVRRRFLTVYDTVNIFNVEGALTARPFKDFELTGSLTLNIFDPENQSKAWHLPSTTINATATYLTLEEKLRLKGELYVENGLPYLNEAGEEDNLNGLFDLSIGAEYMITKNISGFLNLNNLAGNKRQRWANYPTYGINFLGGITARF